MANRKDEMDDKEDKTSKQDNVQVAEFQKPAKNHRAFIIYVIDKDDDGRKQILMLSDLLCCFGINCIIDQYHRYDNILSWPQWVSEQIESCISEEGYILLECSQLMFNILSSSDNPPITMIAGYIYCQSFKHYLHTKAQYFIPFCIDGVSSTVIPHILSERTFYDFPFSKLPQFFSEPKSLPPSFTQDDVKQLLANDHFASLRSLVATLTTQQEICQPTVCKASHTGNIVNPSITSSTTPLSYSESSAIDIISLNTTKQDVLSSHEPSTIDQALPQTTFNTFGVTDRPAVADDHDSHDYEKLKVNYQKLKNKMTKEEETTTDLLGHTDLDASHYSVTLEHPMQLMQPATQRPTASVVKKCTQQFTSMQLVNELETNESYKNFTSNISYLAESNEMKLIINKEQCPFKNSNIVSRNFTSDGGVMVIEEYGLTVTVPKGAIDHHYVEIQAAASLLGPFDIPDDYHPVSPYVWIAADYIFKKQLQIDIEHHADVTNLKDISQLCVLKASCSECSIHNHHSKTHVMTLWDDHYDIRDTICTLFTSHFCSQCLVSKNDQIPDRIIVYLYLPDDYKSADSFRAEMCFCFDLSICKKTIEKRFSERKMSSNLITPLLISLKQRDEVSITAPFGSVDGWKVIHLQTTKITVNEIDFRQHYKTAEDLENDEKRDVYPRRFITQLNCHQRHTLDVTYTLNVIKDGIIAKDYNFNIFIKGSTKSIKEIATQTDLNLPRHEDFLTQKPKMWELSKIVTPEIMANWKDVAYNSLHYDIPKVKSIEEKHHNDPKKCCQELLEDWLCTCNEDESKTWEMLLEQLKEVEELKASVEKIYQKLISQ